MSATVAPPERAIRPEEVLIETVRRLLSGARHVAVGANSPIPAAAAFLAQRLSGGLPLVSLQQSPAHNLFTDGGRELFDVAVLAGNVMVFVEPGTEGAILERVGSHIRADGMLVIGFATDRHYLLDDFDADIDRAGLLLEHRFATWDLRPWTADASFAVSILRVSRRRVRPLSK